MQENIVEATPEQMESYKTGGVVAGSDLPEGTELPQHQIDELVSYFSSTKVSRVNIYNVCCPICQRAQYPHGVGPGARSYWYPRELALWKTRTCQFTTRLGGPRCPGVYSPAKMARFMKSVEITG